MLVVILWHNQSRFFFFFFSFFWTCCEYSIANNDSFEKKMMCVGRVKHFRINLKWASLTKSQITFAEVRGFGSMLARESCLGGWVHVKVKPCGGRTGLFERSPLGASDVAELQPCVSAGLLSLCHGCSSPQISSHVLLTPSCPGKKGKPQCLSSAMGLAGPVPFWSCLLYLCANERGRLGASAARAEHPIAWCSWNSKLGEVVPFGPSRREGWSFCRVCTVTTSPASPRWVELMESFVV